ncbi:MAG: AAA family ATPase [Pseudomonadota bacterium]
MKLSEIAIRNFRLLQGTSMRLDTVDITTILVGPNNSGKTSAIEAMLTFLQRPIKQLSINDFSLGCRDAFKKFEEHVLAPPVAVAAGDAEAGPPPAAAPLPSLPVLSLRLKFDYDDTGPDLAVAGELLMDLDDAATTVMVEIRFGPENPQQLAQAYLQDRDDDQSFADYLSATLHDHYKLDLFKLSPDGNQAERLPDRGILSRLIHIDVVSAQRHIDDREEGSKATRLST